MCESKILQIIIQKIPTQSRSGIAKSLYFTDFWMLSSAHVLDTSPGMISWVLQGRPDNTYVRLDIDIDIMHSTALG